MSEKQNSQCIDGDANIQNIKYPPEMHSAKKYIMQ